MSGRLSQRATQSRRTVGEDDDQEINGDDYDPNDMTRDEYARYLDKYDDFAQNDDQTSLLFKNILKREGFGARDSVKSGGGCPNGRNSYTSRFSSKYGDNRLYLQRLSRNSLDKDMCDQIKIRPKPRKYAKDEMDESYFAKNSNDEGSCSTDERTASTAASSTSGFCSKSKREFKIFQKKLRILPRKLLPNLQHLKKRARLQEPRTSLTNPKLLLLPPGLLLSPSPNQKENLW